MIQYYLERGNKLIYLFLNKMSNQNNLPPSFYFTFILSLILLLYYLSGMLCLISKWNKPFIRARIPCLILFSSSGFFLRQTLSISLFSLTLHSDSHESPSRPTCVISMLAFAVIDIVFFWPVFLRLCYLHRVGSIVTAFYTNSNEELAKANQWRCEIAIFTFLGALSLYKIILFSVIFAYAEYLDSFCSC